jgi:hypothetical protein
MIKRTLRKMAFPVLLLALTAVPFSISNRTSTAAGPAQELTETDKRLLEIVSKNSGVAMEDLELVNSVPVRLPLTRQAATTAKIRLRKEEAEELFTASIDRYGKEVDINALKREEERAYISTYGKLDPALYNALKQSTVDRNFKVAFWLSTGEDLDEQDIRSKYKDADKEEVERLINYRQEQLQRATSVAASKFNYALNRYGYKAEDRPTLTPVVYTSIPAKVIHALLDQDEVQRVYLAENKNEDYLNVAAPAINANFVWSWFGATGTDSRVAIVEDSRVDFDNSCLVTNLGTRVPLDGNVDNHATATAGMVASNNSTHRGISYGAGIYSANGTTYSDSDMSAALDAGASNAHILNNSWGPQCGSANGSLDVHARHADYIVRYIWDTVVAAAGNNGNCTNQEFVDGVASGYNVIAVGNFDDNGTVGWGDDSMSSSSSYKDPTSSHSDREKPEVSAPGTNISSTLMASPGSCTTGNAGSGTSFASPMIAGVAALLMDGRPSLRVFPESVKALILSGATHNIEGSARLSEKDGAGGIDACAAYSNMNNNQYDWLYVTPSSFNSSGYINVPMGWVNAGRRVKVALVWDSNPSSSYATDTLQADLDLNVVGPGASYWSASWDNSYEIVDFTAPSSGNYTLKIKNYRFDGSREYVGVAWLK